MIGIKVNHLVNLQDARYCAAMEVGLLSFCLERGNMYRLPDTMIADITEWVAGPEIVFNFGADFEELNDYQPRLTDTTIVPEFVFIPDHFLPNKAILRVEDPEALSVYMWENLLFDTGLRLELDIKPEYGKELTDFYKQMDSYAERIILNIDAYDRTFIEKLPFLPGCVSMRQCVESDLMNLDYDRFESYLDYFQSL